MAFLELSLSRGLFSDNPLNRAVSAVGKTFQEARTTLAQAIHKDKALVNTQLARARSTIAQYTHTGQAVGQYIGSHKQELGRAVSRTTVEAVKNAAPAVIVGAGVRAAGMALGVQALAVAAGASGVSRGVREATFTLRKGTYAETTKLILKHERDATRERSRSSGPNTGDTAQTVRSFEGLRSMQDRFAKTFVGSKINFLLHGGEKRVAEFAYGKNRHAQELVLSKNLEIGSLSNEKLLALREHAIMARITHGTAADVFQTRQLARKIYSDVSLELKNRGVNGRDAHAQQLALYRHDARVGAVVNAFGQGIVAAPKGAVKAVLGFYATDTILNALHIGSQRKNPLEGLSNTPVAQFVRNAKSSIPHQEASEKVAEVAQVMRVATIGKDLAKDDLYTDSPSIHTHTAVLSSGEVKPVEVAHKMVGGAKKVQAMYAPRPASIGLTESTRAVAPAVTPTHIQTVAAVSRTPEFESVSTFSTVTVTKGSSFSAELFARKVFPDMEEFETAKEYFSQPETAAKVWRIIELNKDQIPPESYERMQLLMKDQSLEHASFGKFWRTYRALYPNDAFGGMDGWSEREFMIPVERMVKINPVETAKLARMEEATSGGGKGRGLAQMVYQSNTNPPTPPPEATQRLTPEQYEAMKAQLLGGGSTSHVANATAVSAGGNANGSLSADQYAAMKAQIQGTGAPKSTQGVSLDPSTTSRSMSSAEYENMKASLSSPSAAHTTALGPNGASSTLSAEEYEKLKLDRIQLAQKQATLSHGSSLTPDKYEEMKRLAIEKNGGVYIAPTPTTTSEVAPTYATEPVVGVGPVDLRNTPDQTIKFASNYPKIFQTVDMPVHQVKDPSTSIDTPAFGEGSWFYDPQEGGLTFIWHSGSTKAQGIQFGEHIRRYVQGGGYNGEPRLGPVQQAYRIQQLRDMHVNLYMTTSDGQNTQLELTNVSHSPLNPTDENLVLGQHANLIGGTIDTVTGRICSWGHIEAIQMLMDYAIQNKQSLPSNLIEHLNILQNPTSAGEMVEIAVLNLGLYLKQDSKFDFAKFNELYGVFDNQTPTADELAAQGYMSRGFIVMHFDA